MFLISLPCLTLTHDVMFYLTEFVYWIDFKHLIDMFIFMFCWIILPIFEAKVYSARCIEGILDDCRHVVLHTNIVKVLPFTTAHYLGNVWSVSNKSIHPVLYLYIYLSSLKTCMTIYLTPML